EPTARDRAGMHGVRELEGRDEPEVRGDEQLERRLRPAAVLRPRRRPAAFEPEALAASPVAGDVAEGGEPRLAPVRAEPEAVDACAADDGDAPAAVGAGAQDGERVVRDLDALCP